MRDGWRLAVGTLTAVPVRPPDVVDRRTARSAMVMAPAAALPLGAAAALVASLASWCDLTPLVAAVGAIGVVALGNRAFHLDGLSDVVDGMAASFDRERSLEVMKSGTSGPAGVVAVVLVMGLQIAALAALLDSATPVRAAVLAGVAVCVSRAALPMCCAVGLEPARPDGLGRLFTQTVPRPVVAVIWLLAAVLLGALSAWAGGTWWRGPVAVVVAVLAIGLLLRRSRVRFGGVSGDVFGAGVEIGLAAVLVGLA